MASHSLWADALSLSLSLSVWQHENGAFQTGLQYIPICCILAVFKESSKNFLNLRSNGNWSAAVKVFLILALLLLLLQVKWKESGCSKKVEKRYWFLSLCAATALFLQFTWKSSSCLSKKKSWIAAGCSTAWPYFNGFRKQFKQEKLGAAMRLEYYEGRGETLRLSRSNWWSLLIFKKSRFAI